jgi:hypothetical protein
MPFNHTRGQSAADRKSRLDCCVYATFSKFYFPQEIASLFA